MTTDKEQAPVMLDARKAEAFAERIHYCRVMLHLHEFLSEAENERVKARQVKRGVLPADAVLVNPHTGKPL